MKAANKTNNGFVKRGSIEGGEAMNFVVFLAMLVFFLLAMLILEIWGQNVGSY